MASREVADRETTAVLEDIRIAEEQIARGEGIEHEAAEEQILANLRTREPKPANGEVVSAKADSVKL